MAITPLPTPPSRADSTTFAARADAFLAALQPFSVELDAAAEDVTTKQGIASTAAATATTKAGEASSSATAASNSAGTATTKASEASSSSAAALASENAAATSETNAANSATAAANSAASVDPQSIATGYYSATEPPIKWPGMIWNDAGSMLRKQRNAANSAWISLGPLFNAPLPQYALADVPTADKGPIYVIGVGNMEWSGTAYKLVRAYLPGEVIQQAEYTSPGSGTNSTANTALHDPFVFIPKSTNSVLTVRFTFEGRVDAATGADIRAFFQLTKNGGTAIGAESQFWAGPASAGGQPIWAPLAMNAILANAATTPVTVAMYGRANASSYSIYATGIVCTITERQNA